MEISEDVRQALGESEIALVEAAFEYSPVTHCPVCHRYLDLRLESGCLLAATRTSAKGSAESVGRVAHSDCSASQLAEWDTLEAYSQQMDAAMITDPVERPAGFTAFDSLSLPDGRGDMPVFFNELGIVNVHAFYGPTGSILFNDITLLGYRRQGMEWVTRIEDVTTLPQAPGWGGSVHDDVFQGVLAPRHDESILMSSDLRLPGWAQLARERRSFIILLAPPGTIFDVCLPTILNRAGWTEREAGTPLLRKQRLAWAMRQGRVVGGLISLAPTGP